MCPAGFSKYPTVELICPTVEVIYPMVSYLTLLIVAYALQAAWFFHRDLFSNKSKLHDASILKKKHNLPPKK